VVICLEHGADLHIAQLTPLSLASVKSRLVLPFWYRLTRVVPNKELLNGCVCLLTCTLLGLYIILFWFTPAVWQLLLNEYVMLCYMCVCVCSDVRIVVVWLGSVVEHHRDVRIVVQSVVVERVKEHAQTVPVIGTAKHRAFICSPRCVPHRLPRHSDVSQTRYVRSQSSRSTTMERPWVGTLRITWVSRHQTHTHTTI